MITFTKRTSPGGALLAVVAGLTLIFILTTASLQAQEDRSVHYYDTSHYDPYGRIGIALIAHAGLNVPSGTFSTSNTGSYSLNVGLDHLYDLGFATSLNVGLHHFAAPIDSNAVNLYQISMNLRYHIVKGRFDAFINLGPGAYGTSFENITFGAYAGAGAEFNLIKGVDAEAIYDFHFADVLHSDGRKFSTIQVGARLKL